MKNRAANCPGTDRRLPQWKSVLLVKSEVRLPSFFSSLLQLLWLVALGGWKIVCMSDTSEINGKCENISRKSALLGKNCVADFSKTDIRENQNDDNDI